jgi:hypothetical protein
VFEDIASGSLRVLHCRSAPYGNGYRSLVNPHKDLDRGRDASRAGRMFQIAHFPSADESIASPAMAKPYAGCSLPPGEVNDITNAMKTITVERLAELFIFFIVPADPLGVELISRRR